MHANFQLTPYSHNRPQFHSQTFYPWIPAKPRPSAFPLPQQTQSWRLMQSQFNIKQVCHSYWTSQDCHSVVIHILHHCVIVICLRKYPDFIIQYHGGLRNSTSTSSLVQILCQHFSLSHYYYPLFLYHWHSPQSAFNSSLQIHILLYILAFQ